MSLSRFHDARGNLTVIEGGSDVPFDIRRIYWLYDVPGEISRAGHAHRNLRQLMVAMSGSCDVTLDDGERSATFHLNRSYTGLYVHPMMWREITNFSSSAVLMVLASEHYDALDYFHDYNEFAAAAKHNS